MENNPLIPLIMSIIGGISGLAALIKVFFDARKIKPDIAVLYEEMATKQAQQIDDLRRRIIALEKELIEKDRLIDEYLEGIEQLLAQLIKLKVEPVWKPEKREKNKNEQNTDFGSSTILR